MENIQDLVRKEARQGGSEYIEMLKSNRIRKRVLVNKSQDYPLADALASGKALLESEDYRRAVREVHRKNAR